MWSDEDLQKATFSAGKFWGVQFYFDQVNGVIKSRVGYTGGKLENPTGPLIEQQNTGHTEAVELMFDPFLVSYDTLVKHFFRVHDPTQVGGQGKYLGDQFRSVIYFHSNDQKVIAETIISGLTTNNQKPIATQIMPASTFYEAEPANQKYTQNTGVGSIATPFDAFHQ